MKKTSESETEQEIFDKLFLKVVDSTYKDKRLYTCFPEMGKPIYDKSGKWIGLDTVGQHGRDLQCKFKREALKKDTLGLVIALFEKGYISKSFNLEKYNSAKFSFRHFDELTDDRLHDYSNWEKKYSKFAGVMAFSKIDFNQDRTSGVLDVQYSCGRKCGIGYRVQIKKTEGKWVISKVEQTSIS